MHRGFGVVVALLSLGACSPGRDVPVAEKAVATFHAQLNANRFDAVYAGAAPEFRSATSGPVLTRLLSTVHRKLGDFRTGKTMGWNDNVSTSGHIVSLRYAASYARGPAMESFSYRIDGDAAVLVGYHTSSDALILN